MSSEAKYRESLKNLLLESGSHSEFLLAAFEAIQLLNPHFNYSSVALQTGFTRSYIRQVVLGKKKLTLRALEPIAKAFKLEADLEKYFQTLYRLDLARETAQGTLVKKLSGELAILRKSLTTKKKSESKHLTSVHWPRVYASLGSEETGSTLPEILERSKVKKEEVLHVLTELEENNLVRIAGGNRYFPVCNHIDLGKNFSYKKIFLHNYELLGKKAESDFTKKEDLFFSSVTCVRQEDLPELKAQFRELLLQFIDRSEIATGSTTVTFLAGLFENGKDQT